MKKRRQKRYINLGNVKIFTELPHIDLGTVQIFAGGFSRGGLVIGAGSGTSDSVPTNLSPGEGVVSVSGMKTLGVAGLNRLNKHAASSVHAPHASHTRELIGTSPAHLFHDNKNRSFLHLTSDANFPIGGRFGFESKTPDYELTISGTVLKSGRDLSRRGTDVAILDYTFTPAPPAPKPMALGVHDDPAPFKTTPMELVMTALRLRGLSVKEIAKKLGVGEHYVKNRNRAVYDKIPCDAVRTHIELALYAAQDGGVLRRAAEAALSEWEHAK